MYLVSRAESIVFTHKIKHFMENGGGSDVWMKAAEE